MTTVLDLRRGLSAEDFIITAPPGGARRARSLPRLDRAFLVNALKAAGDIARPLAWLAQGGFSKAEWRGQLGRDAIPHALQENLKAKLAADRAALAQGRDATQAFGMLDTLRATGTLGMALPYKEGRLAYYTAAHGWLEAQARTGNPLLGLLADLAAHAPDADAFGQRLAHFKGSLPGNTPFAEELDRVATARYGRKLLKMEASAYRDALQARTEVTFSASPRSRVFRHWLAASGLGGPRGQAALALDVVERWVVSAQVARKGPCVDDCTRCPFVVKTTSCHDNRASL